MKSGFFCIDKPKDMTSHSVVSRMRKILNMKKIGHSGTLDPMATGVMVVGFGTSTRLLDYVQSGTKEYIATIAFGEKTNTGDVQGRIIQSVDMSSLNEVDVRNVISKFIGIIEQLPPMVSAIKIDGKKLYEYEREGKVVERKTRSVTIHEIELLDFCRSDLAQSCSARIRVVCSTGTYIRTLAEDIAYELGGVAHLTELVRTKNGCINLEDCIDLEELACCENPFDKAMSPLEVLSHYDQLELNENQAVDVSHGKSITLNDSQMELVANCSGSNFIGWTSGSPDLVAVFDLDLQDKSNEFKSRCVVFLE